MMSWTASYLRSGRGRSHNAAVAETKGRLPMTRAIPVVAARAKCTRKAAREALENSHDGEWHHTGKRAKRTDYYDISAAVKYLIVDGLTRKESDAIKN